MSVNSKMTAIADKIRSLLGINGKLGLDAMDTNLESANTEVATQEELMEEILTTLAEKSANTGGSAKPEQEKTIDITENGTTEVLPDSGKVLSKVTVNVDVPEKEIKLQEKTTTENGEVTPDSGYDGLSKVTVDVQSGGSDNRFIQFIQGTLTEIKDNEVTNIEQNVFYGCQFIESVNFPLVKNVGMYAFQNCVYIKEVNLPLVEYIGNQAFQNCNSMTKCNVPNLKGINNSTFNGCQKIEKFDFPSCTYINANGFIENLSLKAVILRGNSLVDLRNTSAFKLCPHYLGTVDATYNPDGLKDGYIYVPRNLVSSYQTATNWSTFAEQFRALEDYTVDGTITGELDESKI